MAPDESTVRSSDLAETLDYFEGLELILRHLQAHPGTVDAQQLAERLKPLLTYSTVWSAMRYEDPSMAGRGWLYLADNVRRLRDRFVEDFEGEPL